MSKSTIHNNAKKIKGKRHVLHALRSLEGMDVRVFHSLIEQYKASDIWKNISPFLQSIRIKKEKRAKIFHSWRKQRNIPVEEHYKQLGDIQVLLWDDADYPDQLREIHSPPQLLYYRGNMHLLHEPRLLAIVGSRKATQYGKSVLRRDIPELVAASVRTVSGLAFGIDGVVHTETLTAQGNTIAVLGSGLSEHDLYPAAHRSLGEQMVKTGLLISEYPPGSPVYASHFPERNRIIAGLCSGVLVVEAALRSGSLITARLAMESNRDVFAVPGSVFSAQSAGCNSLITQGATPWLHTQTYMEYYQLDYQTHGIELNEKEQAIVQALEDSPQTLDALAAQTALPISELLPILSELQLRRVIEEVGTNTYAVLSNTSFI